MCFTINGHSLLDVTPICELDHTVNNVIYWIITWTAIDSYGASVFQVVNIKKKKKAFK